MLKGKLYCLMEVILLIFGHLSTINDFINSAGSIESLNQVFTVDSGRECRSQR